MACASEKVTMVTPAYNEEGTVGNVILAASALLKQGIIDEFVVIDDGSSDSTAAVAAKMGAKVISLGKNFGKGRAFLEGALYCKRSGADVMITIDADLVGGLSPSYVQFMLSELKSRDDAGKPYMMAVAPVVEGNGKPEHNYSGQRAIRMKALGFLFAGEPGKETFASSFGAKRFVEILLEHPFGLETMLDWKIKPKVRLCAAEGCLKFARAYKNGVRRQLLDIASTTQFVQSRLDSLEALLLQRKRSSEAAGRSAKPNSEKRASLA
ncbi:MAG: glycosyltransferase [Candidatus Anstonellaceae archaeon]